MDILILMLALDWTLAWLVWLAGGHNHSMIECGAGKVAGQHCSICDSSPMILHF
jgi:hypothetical protein